MTVQASTIIDECQRAMNDRTGTRVPASDLVKLLNRAQRDIALARPDTTADLSVFTLVAGARQTLPIAAASLISVAANTTGKMKAITRTDKGMFDAAAPDWLSGTQKAIVQQYMHDHRTPRIFWVYPPAIEGTTVDLETSLYPVDIAAPAAPGVEAGSVTGPISLADEWSTALLMVTLYYAYLTDLEGAGNPSIAVGYKQTAEQILGVQLQATMTAEKET